MKGIQKHIYTAFPRTPQTTAVASPSRVRSNTLYTSSSLLPLNFFDSPPPSNARPILSSTHHSFEAKTQSEAGTHHSHPSLALTAPATSPASLALSISPTQSALFQYPHLPAPNRYEAQSSSPESHVSNKRQRKRYQLDIAAYGIPKRCKNPSSEPSGSRMMHTCADDSNLAVQVGEDAYFIRDNAMGVADGVGGWNRSKHADTRLLTTQSPSAMFAKRLMHFCSAEIESETQRTPAPDPKSIFTTHFPPRRHPRSPSPLFHSQPNPWAWNGPLPPTTDLKADLEDSLEELEDGIDVLMILERAYEQTVKAHVVSVPTSEPTPEPKSASLPMSSVSFSSISGTAASKQNEPHTIPLRSGSSTALIAVLDYIPRVPSSTPSLVQDGSPSYNAVIKIAHLGDCMAMLVRGDDIAWRSEEMWWNFNTPVQLAPPISSRVVTPSSAAHLFTLPVIADDILILASDGLSDNLWDEDVLDEVVRFRRSFLDTDPSTEGGASGTLNPTNTLNAGATPAERLLRRRTLAGMLSEALCSRASRVSENKKTQREADGSPAQDDEVPFARRAREAGKRFSGGKTDDISVIVAVISPADELAAH